MSIDWWGGQRDEDSENIPPFGVDSARLKYENNISDINVIIDNLKLWIQNELENKDISPEMKKHLRKISELNDPARFEYIVKRVIKNFPIFLCIPTSGGKGTIVEYIKAFQFLINQESAVAVMNLEANINTATPGALDTSGHKYQFAQTDDGNLLLTPEQEEKHIFKDGNRYLFLQQESIHDWDAHHAYNARLFAMNLGQFLNKLKIAKPGDTLDIPDGITDKIVDQNDNTRIGIVVQKVKEQDTDHTDHTEYQVIRQGFVVGKDMLLIDSFLPEVYHFYYLYLEYRQLQEAYKQSPEGEEFQPDISNLTFKQYCEVYVSANSNQQNGKNPYETTSPGFRLSWHLNQQRIKASKGDREAREELEKLGVENMIRDPLLLEGYDPQKTLVSRMIRRIMREKNLDAGMALMVFALSEIKLDPAMKKLKEYIDNKGNYWEINPISVTDDTDPNIIEVGIRERNSDKKTISVKEKLEKINGDERLQIVIGMDDQLYLQIKNVAVGSEVFYLPFPKKKSWRDREKTKKGAKELLKHLNDLSSSSQVKLIEINEKYGFVDPDLFGLKEIRGLFTRFKKHQ